MNQNTVPDITVIMPVFNAQDFLSESIESILNQTFRNFEFLIFNDGSRDLSGEIIKQYNDDRIKYFDFDYNSGYIHHLNQGIRISKGRYIARMDADDISDLQRFEKQVDFLDRHKNVGVCGSFIKFIGSNKILRLPVEDNEIKVNLFFKNIIVHPSVMMRSSLLKANDLIYDSHLMPAEDFALWHQMSQLTSFYNIPEPLLNYRLHQNQVSELLSEIQIRNYQITRDKILSELIGKELDSLNKNLNIQLTNVVFNKVVIDDPFEFSNWIKFLINSNNNKHIYSIRKFKNVFLKLNSEAKKKYLIDQMSNSKNSNAKFTIRHIRLFFTLKINDQLSFIKKITLGRI